MRKEWAMTMDSSTKRAPGPTAPPEIREQVRALVEQGEAAAVKRLGISRIALARLVAGLPVRYGTIAAARAGLAAT